MDKIVSEIIKPYEVKMEKTLSVLQTEFGSIRAGRANPSVLDKIKVNYYGVPTALAQIGNISVPEARILMIQPWDAKLLKDIEKEIQKSDIGINPSNDGKVIRLVFPPLTEERRKELCKQVRKMGEEAKVAIRSIRREAVDYFKNEKKKSAMTEDDLKYTEKGIQELTDKFILNIDKTVEAKESEILEV